VKARPVIISGTGTLSRSFWIYSEGIPEKHSSKELQNMIVPGTAHILRNTVMYSSIYVLSFQKYFS
jgi:hypothetical protein